MRQNPVTEKIIRALQEQGCWYEKYVHKPVRTSEEAAKVRRGYLLKQGAKAIIVRIKTSHTDARFVMLVVPGDKRFDTKKVKKLFHAKDIRFATEDEVYEVTGGVQVGGVPPFGNIFHLEVVADPTLFQNEMIVFNAGDRSVSVAMKCQDYREIVKPVVATIV